MAIGINLSDNVKVELGEIKEQLLKDLDNDCIHYVIAFDKLNKEGIKETIMHFRELETEIIIRNDIVYYIKSGNTQYTHLDVITDIETDNLSHIKTIKDLVINRYGNLGYNLKIEKIDTKTMNITVILTSDNDKVRIQILRSSKGEVYINTLMKL